MDLFRSTALAAELRDYQGQLGDYNMLLDKMHADTDMEQMEQELQQLSEKNKIESQVVEQAFRLRQEYISHCQLPS